MPTHQSCEPTPHLHAVNLSPFRGRQVLGEPLDVLVSALLRMRFGPERDGMAEISGVWPRREADALIRAMARTEADDPADRRSTGQRDLDRFLRVVGQVFLSWDVAIAQAGAAPGRVPRPGPWDVLLPRTLLSRRDVERAPGRSLSITTSDRASVSRSAREPDQVGRLPR